MPKYILIAGVNGAGKSTLYHILDNLHDMPRINIDEIVRDFGDWRNPSDVMEAGKIAVRQLRQLLGEKRSIHYVGVDSVEIAKARVKERVKNGGHGIPDIDIQKRYLESFLNLNILCLIVILFISMIIQNHSIVLQYTDLMEIW